jgi:hypothetical protein
MAVPLSSGAHRELLRRRDTMRRDLWQNGHAPIFGATSLRSRAASIPLSSKTLNVVLERYGCANPFLRSRHRS